MRAPLLALVLLAAPLPGAAQAPAGDQAPSRKDPQPAAPEKPQRPFSKEAVLEVVASHRDQIQRCYEEAMAARGATAKSAPRGRVVMAWTITTTGLTADVRVKRSEIKDELVTDCMVQAIRFWEFPRPKTRQPVEFPFDLKPAGSPAGEKDRE